MAWEICGIETIANIFYGRTSASAPVNGTLTPKNRKEENKLLPTQYLK